MMIARFHTFAPPVQSCTGPSLKAVSARLAEIAPSTDTWPRPRDLALTEAACRGHSIPQIAARLRLSEAAVRTRWTALKNAACVDDLPFGLREQEALLIALRQMSQRGAA